MIPILKKNEPWPEDLPVNGFVVLINKPVDWTSFDVVNKIRRHLKIKKVGHAGTLDPFATGLLIVGVGKGTRHLQNFAGLDKRYTAVIRLGIETDTYDATGKILEEKSVEGINEKNVRKALDSLTGEQWQVPPMFSAKKVDGVPLYKLARKGKVVERKPVSITVYRADLIKFQLPALTVDLLVSKGTYVRSFAHDLGEKLGVGAHLQELVRTEIGAYALTDSFEINEFLEIWKSKVRQ